MIPVNNIKKSKNYALETINEERPASAELEDKMRLFVNMIIDKVLEERKQGIYRS